MNWNKWVRQSHRWLCIAFTAAVIINAVAVVRGRYTNQLGLLRFKAGKITEEWNVWNELSVLRQLGLLPQQ